MSLRSSLAETPFDCGLEPEDRSTQTMRRRSVRGTLVYLTYPNQSLQYSRQIGNGCRRDLGKQESRSVVPKEQKRDPVHTVLGVDLCRDVSRAASLTHSGLGCFAFGQENRQTMWEVAKRELFEHASGLCPNTRLGHLHSSSIHRL